MSGLRLHFYLFIIISVCVSPIPGQSEESPAVLIEQNNSTFSSSIIENNVTESEVISTETNSLNKDVVDEKNNKNESETERRSDLTLSETNPSDDENNGKNNSVTATKSDLITTENNSLDKENNEENNGENEAVPEAKTNTTVSEPNRTDAAYRIYSNCLTDKSYGTVEIVNATRLMELLIIEPTPANRSEAKKDGKMTPRTCVLVLFYSRWCVFSSQAAPHFNALPKFFPHIKAVAIDASKYQNFNMQFGIVGVPTLMFVYNGKPLIKFNDTSYTLESFARFVTDYTALEPNGSLYVTSADFSGPIPSTPSNETDYCLVLSWAFIAACAIYFSLQSQWWKQFVELIQNTWRESNAQHEHTD